MRLIGLKADGFKKLQEINEIHASILHQTVGSLKWLIKHHKEEVAHWEKKNDPIMLVQEKTNLEKCEEILTIIVERLNEELKAAGLIEIAEKHYISIGCGHCCQFREYPKGNVFCNAGFDRQKCLYNKKIKEKSV